MSDYFAHDHLLTPPMKRAAFSDRTAYLMAEMSRLAYFRFEGGANLDDILELASALIPDKERYSELETLIRNTVVTNSAAEAEMVLARILAEKGFELVSTFNNVATDAQAFLCRRTDQNIAILSFRGTEKKLKDIKADAKALLKTVPYGNDQTATLHSGYYEQYASLAEEIQAALSDDRLDDLQLFITGHSLGGALAIVATKFLASDTTGACYTFGSPPVGTNKFDEDIKTPIYRVINHVDVVPRLPNPYMVAALRLLGFVVELALSPMGKVYTRFLDTAWYQTVQKFLIDAGRYRQSGYGSYLVGNGADARLRYNVMFYDRLFWWSKQFKNLLRKDFEIITDHSIELYASMLAVWATRRTR